MEIQHIIHNRFEIPDRPCEHCGSTEYLHVEESPEECSGYECYECGRGFIVDPVQSHKHHNPPLSVLETMYHEEEEL